MTKLMAGTVLAMFLVSPVFAKSTPPKHGHAASLQGLQMQAHPPQAVPQVVRPDGKIGQDPDPNVRLEILRESHW